MSTKEQFFFKGATSKNKIHFISLG
ncbi:hypothetical protein CP08DC60_0500A, partial [Chlamydia psittaci 08DC60]